MQTSDKAARIGTSRHQAAGLLGVMLLGSSFLVASFAARFLFPGNPVAADLAAVLGALVLLAPILRTAAADLLGGEMHMNELVALAVLAAMAQGDYRTAGAVAFIMLLAMVIETRTAEGAHAAIEGLVRLSSTIARRLRKDESGERFENVPAEQLSVGDRVRVMPGDRIPADGVIESGRTTLDESTITGESFPCDKGPGQDVFAGTMNLTGRLDVRVSRVGEDTTLGQVRNLILAAERTRLPVMRVIDRCLGYYTPAVLMIAGLVWFFTGDGTRVVSLLVVACPCALILAAPSALVAALAAAARSGILIRDVAHLEGASRLDAFVLDKTGTLTTGRLGVARLAPCQGVDAADLLEAALAAERFSAHPAALALAGLAGERGLAAPAADDFHEEAGQGVRARMKDAQILCGRWSWLLDQGVAERDLEKAAALEEGYSAVFVARNGRLLGWIGFQDEVRGEAAECVAGLRAAGIRRVTMVTGDREAVARRVAGQVGCPEFRAECLPGEKAEDVKALRRAGYRVAFVGDGVNDAPALAAAEIGIAMGAAGSDIAIHSAAIALMNNDLRKLPGLILLSRWARRVMLQNIALGGAFIVGGLAVSGMGWMHPVVAALLHNAGALLVVLNSARLFGAGEEEDPGGAHVRAAQ